MVLLSANAVEEALLNSAAQLHAWSSSASAFTLRSTMPRASASSADEALALGIVDRKVNADALLDQACSWAAELSSASSTALALSKTILNQTFELTSHDVFAQGSQAQGICYTSSEHRAAVAAFLAKTGR